jgi:hypothetical protein
MVRTHFGGINAISHEIGQYYIPRWTNRPPHHCTGEFSVCIFEFFFKKLRTFTSYETTGEFSCLPKKKKAVPLAAFQRQSLSQPRALHQSL